MGRIICPCHCDVVTVDEVIRAVSIALESPYLPPSAAHMKECLPADPNLDYLVTVDELVAAVGRAMGGCR
jgi:hypothetical protein